MPTESLGIKGQFFNLKTELSLSPSKGYTPLSTKVSRRHGQPTQLDDESNLAEIYKIIKKNIAVLELNFDSWNIITAKDYKSNKIDISKLVSMKEFTDNLIASLKLNPVIAVSRNEQKTTYEIIKQYIKQGSPDIKNMKEVDFFVLTGEMIWSGWTGRNIIAYILSELSPGKVFWHLDNFGVWEMLMHEPLRGRISSGINQKSLAPNLYYYKAGKKDKIIRLIDGEEKRDIIIDGKHRFFAGMERYVLDDVPLPEYFAIGDSKINFNENSQTIAFEKSVSSILRNEKAEITLPDKDIKVEGEIGFYRQKKFKVVKLLEYTKRIKLLVGHGQKVEKNEVIAQNLSLSGRIFSESFTSPVDGYIDLSMKKDGIMLIWSQNDGKTELDISKFGKYIGGQNGKFHKFETKTTIVPIDLVLNRPVSGFFVKQIEGDFKGLPKILMLSYSDLKNFKTEQLLNDYVRGLLFDHLTFAQIEKMNKTRSEIFTLFTVAAIDGFSDEINQIFFHEIISSIGLMAVLNGNAIEFINSDIKSGSKLFEDKLVKYISYDSKFRYYVETIKIGLDKVLLSNSRDVKEANICNLLYIEDGIKK